MFSTPGITGDTANALLLSAAVLGILILGGVVLRILFPVLRRLFIPAALIGGVIGAALGPFGLKLFSEEMNTTWAALPGVLITLVFAPMLMGQAPPKLGESAKIAAPHIFYSFFSTFVIVGVPCVISALLLERAFDVNAMFPTIMEISWPGGHGTAAGMGPVFEELGWTDGGSLALGSATFGLLFGIFSGMVLINIAARKGHLASARSSDTHSSSDLLTSAQAETHSIGRLDRSSVDNFAFHAALISVAVLFGWILQYFLEMLIPGMPLFPLAMIGGLAVQSIVSRTRLGDAVDKKTLNSIQGFALDLLVVSAVASISIPVLLENFAPLMILTVVAAALSITVFYVVGPRIFRKDWFEHAIINYGAMTAVMSVGLMLLRSADPQMKTDAARAYALRSPFASPLVGGGLVTSVLPVLAVSLGSLWLGLGALACAAILLLIAKLTGLWKAPVTAVQSTRASDSLSN